MCPGLSPDQQVALDAHQKEHLEKIELTDIQREQYNKIDKRYREKFIENRNSSAPNSEKKQNHKQLEKQKSNELKAVLQPAQFEKYLVMKKKEEKILKEYKKGIK